MRSHGRMPPASGWDHGAQAGCAGEDCPCRQGEPVHPPLLLAFDPEAGEYRRAGECCTAQWAQSQHGRAAGQICGQEAGHQVGDVWVCEYHYRRAREWFRGVQPRIDFARSVEQLNVAQAEIQRRQREDRQERARARREEAALERELAREQIRAEVAARAESSLIYYVRRESDGMIKIGTSRVAAERLYTLKNAHGPLRLMATHGGGFKEEHEMHDRFSALRITPRGEWFRPELPLLVHINKVRSENEAPQDGMPPVVSVAEIRRTIGNLKKQQAPAGLALRSSPVAPASAVVHARFPGTGNPGAGAGADRAGRAALERRFGCGGGTGSGHGFRHRPARVRRERGLVCPSLSVPPSGSPAASLASAGCHVAKSR